MRDACASSDARFRSSDSLEIIILNQTPFGDDAETINLQDWLPQNWSVRFIFIDYSLNYVNIGATRFTNKQTWRTFTVSQDCLTIPIRVYPVIPVNHLISFTGLDLATRFSRKLSNGAKRNCVIREKTLKIDLFSRSCISSLFLIQMLAISMQFSEQVIFSSRGLIVHARSI